MPGCYVAERAAGREHIPLYPKGFVALRIIQLVLGIICLGLTAYAVAVAPITGAALMLFTAIVTLLTSIYLLVAHFGPPKAYNYWAILGLDIFHVIFWLISFALLAAQAALVISYYGNYYVEFTIYGSIIAAAAGLGGVNWVTYLVALIMHSIALHRHRGAGLRAMPGQSTSAPAAAGAPVGGEKIQMQPQSQPQPQQPQTQTHYPQEGQVHEAPIAQQTYQQQPHQQQIYQEQPQAYQQQTPAYQQQPQVYEQQPQQQQTY
ncbi:hypothetical protein F4808DRAFT_414408 [Astrocystis sublimbata]|nr:hypothetical protein F4808DRAFT_414408 [Astrocystis sublimbata]